MSAVAPRSARRKSAGYTLVELMMSLALMTVGVLGIVSMQKISVVSNAHAKNLATAQRIAQTWATQLQMDSNSWRTLFGGAGVLTEPVTPAIWERPAYRAGRVGAAFDALGAPLTDSAADLLQARYCVHTRLSWLYTNTNVAGNGVLRAEIRVYWLRDGQSVLVTDDGLCGPFPLAPTKVGAIGQATSNYSFLYQTVGIRQHSQI